MTGPWVVFDHVQHPDPVQSGHHNISQDDIRNNFTGPFETFEPVSGGSHFVIISKDGHQVTDNILIVLNYQQYRIPFVPVGQGGGGACFRSRIRFRMKPVSPELAPVI